MLAFVQMALFLIAVAGVIACSIAMLNFVGAAMMRRRSQEERMRFGMFAALSFAGLIAFAVAGFVGIGALLYPQVG